MSDEIDTLTASHDADKATDRTTEFSQLYERVQTDVSKALSDLSDINIASTKGNKHLEAVRETLTRLQENFSNEIDYLDSQAEWETFTMAFFGETNAGKSAIIESLRILFQEQDRQALIARNQAQTRDLQATFSSKTEQLIQELSSHYNDFSIDLSDLSRQASQLRDAVRDDNATTRETVSRETDRMIESLEARHNTFQKRTEEQESAIAELQTLIQDESQATRAAFSQDAERLLETLRIRGQSYQKDMAAMSDDVHMIATIARRESEAEQAARLKRYRLRLVLGIGAGLTLGLAAGAAFGVFQG